VEVSNELFGGQSHLVLHLVVQKEHHRRFLIFSESSRPPGRHKGVPHVGRHEVGRVHVAPGRVAHGHGLALGASSGDHSYVGGFWGARHRSR
jgi:hypothetical protein